MTRRFLLPILAFLLALISACFAWMPIAWAEATSEDTVCIGMVLYGMENDYMLRLAGEASQYANEKGIKLTIYTGDYDAATQLIQVEAMISNGIDGIILVPQSVDSSTACVDRAMEAGIPIITLNTRVSHPGLTCRVGSDDREAGRLLMSEAANALGGEGVIAILEGPVGQSAQLERRAGMREALQPYEGLHIASCKTANWSSLEARIMVEKWLETFETLDAIIAESDSMALGASAVCREHGRDDILIFGIDGSAAALEAVARGEMRMTIFQNAGEQAKTALDTICAAVSGEPVEPEYWIPLETVNADNVQEYLGK